MDTIPDDDPMKKEEPLAGLDPAELLRQGAAEDTFVDGANAPFEPPPMEEIAAAFPQFEILGLIGKGGMGAVYKVRQKDLDRIVALKILPPAIGRTPEFSERFTREARALAKLNHPGIVTIHEFGQQDGLHFILMEFVDGVNLAQLIKTGRISPREALAIVPQICDALQYAHDQGIVHRDIKPENLLLDRKGRVKVADFGIAKVVAAACDPIGSGDIPVPADQTLAGKIIGTPQYMAPEQFEHPSEVDHRADIYALGVVFYQMLTGELPGKDLQAPSRKFQIDVRLDEIVLQALEKNPELRYQSAGEFRTMVETVAMDQAGADAGLPASPGSRFSRTAIVGACWAPLFFVLLVFWFSPGEVVVEPSGAPAPAPPIWQVLLMFTLLPLGLTAPFGTTILGWIAVAQIRRSAGKLHGMWLAVFDGLLFPLLFLAGLIGWFWHWVFSDLIRAAIIAGEPELSTFEKLLVSNATAFTVMATLVTWLIAVAIIVRRVWRKTGGAQPSAPMNPAPASKGPAGMAIAIGCGVLALGGVLVVGLGVLLLIIRYNAVQSHQRFRAAQEREREIAEFVARAEQNAEPVANMLLEHDWKTLAGENRLSSGTLVTEDGRSCLKIENPNDEPMNARLLTITSPPIKAKRYAVRGQIRYENVQGAAYLETWNVFPQGRYFSRTSEAPGSEPMGQLTGTSGWREFALPFDRAGTADAPDRIELNLHLPGKGVVYLGPLKLIEFGSPVNDGVQFERELVEYNWKTLNEAATAWLAGIDAGEYGRCWNDAAGLFRKSITEDDWSEAMTKLRQPLGDVKSRSLVGQENAQALPGLPDGTYAVFSFETSFSQKEKARETVTFAWDEDGTWKAAGYFIR